MLDQYKVAKYKFICEVGEQGLELPPYKGSTLRGGFGKAFKKMVCFQPEQNGCTSCILVANCPYGYIFETAPSEGGEKLRNYESIPRPFVIEPPLEEKRIYKQGEELVFNLILIGKAISFLPYFIIAFQEVGRIGIGKGRRPFTLKSVMAVNPLSHQGQEIYNSNRSNLEKAEVFITGKDFMALDQEVGQIQLSFVTMTRIQYEQSYAEKLEFHMLIRNLLRRISTTSYYHNGFELDLDFQGLIERAKAVERDEDSLHWVNWERYSSRQDSKINLGGTVGTATYKGQLSEFMPLLRIGELIHLGKGTVFGMGKYEIL